MSNFLQLINQYNYEKIIQFILIFAIIYLLLQIIKISVIQRINKLKLNTTSKLDQLSLSIINSLGSFFYLFIPIYFTSLITNISTRIDFYLSKISIIFIIYYTTKIISVIVNFGFNEIIEQHKKQKKRDITLIRISNTIIQTILWLIAILIVLQNFQFNISTLIGGLGITGIAVAFGMQNVLKDVFSFLSIYIDKPFNVGDSIEIDNNFCTVKQIGIRSTRLKTLTGDELIIPNQIITQSKIRNFKKLTTRRSELSITIDQTTPITKLKEIPTIIEKIISQIELAEFKRCHFKTISESSFVFEIVYTLKSDNFVKYMDTRQKINLGILQEFKKHNILLSTPTQEIHIKK